MSYTLKASRSRPFSTTPNRYSKSTSAATGSTQDIQQKPDLEGFKGPQEPVKKIKKKTMAELDEELKLKMENMSGDGGSAGVEYENGKAEGLKRGVKDNMFRVI